MEISVEICLFSENYHEKLTTEIMSVGSYIHVENVTHSDF